MRKLTRILTGVFIITTIFYACSGNKSTEQKENMKEQAKNNFSKFKVKHADWVKTANIYEVNIRQYTKEGTFKAFEAHLPRLKEMGVDILWLMPIFPVGEKNRKGGMGSAYSVKDYVAVNPDYGTMEDFKNLVAKVHENGMHIILDWVANHTAWDHPWTQEHPDWYTKDSTGNFMPPKGTDWSDVIDLNYDNLELRIEMINSLKFWVKEANIDGFRCDVAGMVPTDFWNTARKELDSIKPVFMLAEAEQADLHYKAFDMTYGWNFHHLMNEVAQGKKTVKAFDAYFKKDSTVYPADAIRMYFTSNHDENTWNGTVFERMGDAYPAMAVLTFTIPGMPLIYSGQEAGLNKRLAFFEKDLIDWEGGKDFKAFYARLIKLKKEHPALWNGAEGGSMQRIATSADDKIFAFIRKKGNDELIAVFNFSPETQKVKLTTKEGVSFKDIFTEKVFSNEQELKAWDYKVFVNN
ncbi:MAG: alpha-glucosidase C-terminal domain-containing protein [Bacteroidales bacterium]|nr:alpha-glucosidase C-terminal domain-containing protein [Bacteroidales bacterium]